MLFRERRRSWAAVLVLAAALVVPASPARAAGPETSGGLGSVWEWVWQWVSAALAADTGTNEAGADRSSFIDPNG